MGFCWDFFCISTAIGKCCHPRNPSDKPCGVDTVGAEAAEPGVKVVVRATMMSKQLLKRDVSI